MSTAIIERPDTTTPSSRLAVEPVVALKRRTIDSILIGFGVVATVAFVVAGGLLTWGHNFSSDYVSNELSSQNITFPSAADLNEEGRTDLVKFADQQPRHRRRSRGLRQLHQRPPRRASPTAQPTPTSAHPRAQPRPTSSAAVDAGQPQAAVDALQAKADDITGQRNTLFKGETLRGLLLSAYAWSTVGMIAGIAAIGAFIAAGMMAILVGLGLVHHRRTPKTA